MKILSEQPENNLNAMWLQIPFLGGQRGSTVTWTTGSRKLDWWPPSGVHQCSSQRGRRWAPPHQSLWTPRSGGLPHCQLGGSGGWLLLCPLLGQLAQSSTI
jgi:hypothetical protein